ncbi:hypothetical protein PHO31112_03913 [Pandoraea horticolens]|uniref:Uncharacterized protein n=1 Tax=Pandoraea horticolens TaxID=2508298 RepID=A0A5E4XK62_9BURK|nr:hypothetical protein [Pandoraea horticolens]VVE36555.1 hypothetical protein PHO31112_03913 [Pandoraea horticolens]
MTVKSGRNFSPSLPVLVLGRVGALPKAVAPFATGDGNALAPKTVTSHRRLGRPAPHGHARSGMPYAYGLNGDSAQGYVTGRH